MVAVAAGAGAAARPLWRWAQGGEPAPQPAESPPITRCDVAEGIGLGLYRPDDVGALDDRSRTALTGLFRDLADRWSLDPNTDDRGTIDARLLLGLEAQDEQSPSYLHEYENAADVYETLRADPSGGDALDRIVGSGPVSAREAQTRLELAQAFVVAEFISLHLACGAAKAFGYSNYVGYPGGPLAG